MAERKDSHKLSSDLQPYAVCVHIYGVGGNKNYNIKLKEKKKKLKFTMTHLHPMITLLVSLEAYTGQFQNLLLGFVV